MEAKDLRLKMILTSLDTSVQELADEIGANRTVVSRVLAGQRAGKRLRSRLAEAIHRRIDDLLPPPAAAVDASGGKEASL